MMKVRPNSLKFAFSANTDLDAREKYRRFSAAPDKCRSMTRRCPEFSKDLVGVKIRVSPDCRATMNLA
jgi:hypothetical protein